MSIDTHKGSNGESKKIYLGNTEINKIYFNSNLVYRNAYEIDLLQQSYTFISYPSSIGNCRIVGTAPQIGMEATANTSQTGYYQGIKWRLDNKELISYTAIVDLYSTEPAYGNGFMIKDNTQLLTDNFDAYGYAINFNTGYRQFVTLQANVNTSKTQQFIVALITGSGSQSMLIRSLKALVRDI